MAHHDKHSVDTTLSDGGSHQFHHWAITKVDYIESALSIRKPSLRSVPWKSAEAGSLTPCSLDKGIVYLI